MSKFKTQPFKHQLDGLIASGGREFFAYFCEMGTGKTWMAINDLASMWGEGKADAAIVFAPKGVHTNWVINELPKHMPDWVRHRAVAWKSGAGVREMERIHQILKPEQGTLRILTMNWDALVHASGFNFAHKFCTTTQKLMIIGDESQRIKNPQAGTTKALMKLRKFSTARRIMSGSSVLNSPFDLFSQITFLDKYILQTDSFFSFKTEYAEMLQPGNRLLTGIMKQRVRMDPAVYLRCQTSANAIYDICAKNGRLELVQIAEAIKMHLDDRDYEAVITACEALKNELNPKVQSVAKTELLKLIDGVQKACVEFTNRAAKILNNPRRLPQIVAKGKDGKKKYRNLEKLKALVDPHCFRAFKDECLDLPPKIYKRSWYDMSARQRAVYKKMKDEARLLLADGNESPVNKLAALMKLAQICSGFAIEPGSRNVIEIEPKVLTPKLELLKERLEDKDFSTGGVIVWARFREEQEQIERVLQDLGLTYGVYNGATSDDERDRIKLEFESGEIEVFLGQQRAGGTGITLVRADYVLYYSNTFSLEERAQSEDRAHRIGQGKKVVYEDLLGTNTIEPKVLKVLEDKQELADVLSGKQAVSFLDDDDEG